MNIVKSLIKYLTNNKEINKDEAPEGLCPNCWGRQEYGGNFYEAVKNHGLDVKTKSPEVGWIKDYADRHLNEISFEYENEEGYCQMCKLRYRKEDV